MKQRKGSADCYAIVSCMITKQPLSRFKWLYGTPPYYDSQFFHFLLINGWQVGLGYKMSADEEYVTAKESDEFTFDWTLKGNKAAIVVKSETRKNTRHIVYWDGQKVWDPNPLTEDGRDLGSYMIHLIWPINKMNARMWAWVK